MRFIILLFFISSAFAKSNWCEFDTEFAEKYIAARKNYASSLSNRRGSVTDPADYSYGSKRARTFGTHWAPVSMKQKVKQLYGDAEVEIVVKNNGKIMIYPKDMTSGQPVILMDPSGDYFRIAKSKIKDGVVLDQSPYYDVNGQPIIRPKGIPDATWESKVLADTHFKALP